MNQKRTFARRERDVRVLDPDGRDVTSKVEREDILAQLADPDSDLSVALRKKGMSAEDYLAKR